jgi:hypothetical protein
MRYTKFLLGCIGAAVLSTVVATSPAFCGEKPTDAAKAQLSNAFDRLLQLVGDWEEQSPKDPATKGTTMIQYRLTGGGTALAETIFPGTKIEMLSVYYRDGDGLAMNHFCCVGNQPRFQAKIGKNKDELIFEFAGGPNIDPSKDMHIHGGVIRFVDADHIHSEWYMFNDGKQSETHGSDLVRKKK